MNSKHVASPVIVGVDGSESSIAALREAERLAASLNAPLQALMCWNYPSASSVPYGPGSFDFKGAAEKVLDASLENAFGLDWPANLSTRLEQGSPRAILIEASKDAALLVLGRRGKGGFRGLLMGSVSSACTAHAHCPVLVVHAPQTGESHV